MDETRAEELIENFSTIDRYIHDTWEENFYADAEVLLDGERADSDIESSTRQQLLEKQMEMYKANRLRNARFLLRGLRFVNKKGQPLRMMRRLELDPELLEQPLYH